MNEIQLRDRLFELFPPESDGDWDDVLRRSALPRRGLPRISVLLAAALLATLVVGSALALSGRLGLFRGTPVKDLSPRERFLLSELDLKGRLELIAKRGSKAFYVIRGRDGRPCYFIGDARTNLTPAQTEMRVRFGGGGASTRASSRRGQSPFSTIPSTTTDREMQSRGSRASRASPPTQ